LGQVLCTLFLSPLSGFGNAMDMAAVGSNLTQVAFALAEHRAQRGSYPPRLADLAPKYIPAVPKDVFAGDADLHYARQGDGYLLYSVGPNGRDDGGRTLDEYFAAVKPDAAKASEQWDDIVVRVPAKP
jgi:hypothetical protein